MMYQVYGDYEIVRPIGKGKFAIVYRAQRLSDGEIVALKRISVDMIDAKARDKCLKEVGLLQSLDHPNIIKYLDSFISDDDLVIVVEWAAAGDLKRQLRKAQEKSTPFEERIIWKYFSQIADAIKHMHEKRIMHRDLKPANIFLTLDGTIKVGDLGLSRELSEHTVQAHSKVGTPLYMSPEVLRGDGYGFGSDTWSLGCLLYELAMLKSPFKQEGLNLYSLFQKISQGDYHPLSDNYSEELRDLVSSMMSTKPEDRPQLADVCAVASRLRIKYADAHQKNKRLAAQAKVLNSSDGEGITPNNNNAPREVTSPPTVGGQPAADNKGDRNDIPAGDRADLKQTREKQDTEVSEQDNETKNGLDDKATPQVHAPTKFQRFGPKAAPSEQNSRNISNNEKGGTSGALQSAATPVPAKQPKQVEVRRRTKPLEKDVSGTRSSKPRSDSARALSREKEIIGNDEQLSMDNDPVDPSKRPRSSEKNSTKQNALAAILKDSSPAYSSMSSLYDKLTILGFQSYRSGDEDYRIMPLQFAVDLAQVGLANKRHLLPPGSPFLYFVSVASWLFDHIEAAGNGYRAPKLEAEQDPPMAIAKHILLEAQVVFF